MAQQKSRTLKTQTPGEPAKKSAEVETAETEEVATDETSDQQEAETLAPEVQAAVDAAVARVAEKYETEIEQRVAAKVKELRRKKPTPVTNLPKQEEVDSNKIKRAVLTRDGYVCPAPKPEDKKAI